MYTALLASAAVLASTAYAGSPGSAIVLNACSYDVQLSSVPAQYGGYDTTEHTLSPGQSYTQQWTQLSNGAGWSIKLAKNAGDSSIMQYEYTFQNDGTIWYDLSCVNGNPWDKNWEITAAGGNGCSPKQSAYRYATDDAYGMQSCNSDADVTVTLCSGESKNDDLVSSIATAAPSGIAELVNAKPAAAAAPTTTSTTTPAPAPAPTTTSTSTTAAAPSPAETTQKHAGSDGYRLGYNANGNFFNAVAGNQNKAVVNNKAEAAQPTTFATAVATQQDGDVVTVYDTVVETEVAYATYVPGKRHVHHPDHPHFR